jgi:hypothetical protein
MNTSMPSFFVGVNERAMGLHFVTKLQIDKAFYP